MEEIIQEKFGCQIIDKEGKLFIRFDQGEIAIKMVDYQITSLEAEKAMKSEQDAYEVILEVQKRNKA